MKKMEKRQKVELLSEGKENTGANYSAISYTMCHFATEKYSYVLIHVIC